MHYYFSFQVNLVCKVRKCVTNVGAYVIIWGTDVIGSSSGVRLFFSAFSFSELLSVTFVCNKDEHMGGLPVFLNYFKLTESSLTQIPHMLTFHISLHFSIISSLFLNHFRTVYKVMPYTPKYSNVYFFKARTLSYVNTIVLFTLGDGHW